MKISIERDVLLKPLQQVIGAVEKRNTMPALANILIKAEENTLQFTGTDLEIELHASIDHPVDETGETTLPARKLMDICKALPEGAQIVINAEADKATVRSGRSRFSLITLPATEFPVLEEIPSSKMFSLPQSTLKSLIEKTAFAMAHQDVRYYLNGLMLEVAPNQLRSVATDGHRLALGETSADIDTESTQQVIVPRKGIHELSRLLEEDGDAQVQISANHIRVSTDGLRFTSKLIDGRFPEYDRVLPKGGDKDILIDRDILKHALTRASILSNEKYRGIRLLIQSGSLKIQAHNPEQEEAEDELEIPYQGDGLEIGFNVNYLLDVLNTIKDDNIIITLKDSNSSALIKGENTQDALYVVMPMRL
jgi:DNA polymerase-3 subunit beta